MLQTVRRKPIGRKFKTPEDHADWTKHDRLAGSIEAIACKAVVVAWALEGIATVDGSDAASSIQAVAFEIKDALDAIADEIRGEPK